MGKSLLAAKLAYHITNGAEWPDKTECPQGDVILMQAEDSNAMTVRPRYDAAKVNIKRVRMIHGAPYLTRGKKELIGSFDLGKDLPRLVEQLRDVEQPRAVIIDPLGSYLGSGVDTHRENSVRSVLNNIKIIANKYNVAFILVVHLRKGGADEPVLSRVLGSVAFTGFARAAWGVAHDEEDPNKRYFLAMKHNLTSGAAPGYEFHLGTAENGTGAVTWGKISHELASKRMVDHGDAAQSKAGDAVEMLKEFLADGPRKVTAIKEEAHQQDFKWRTIERTKAKLGIKSYKVSHKEGGHWMWRLSDSDIK